MNAHTYDGRRSRNVIECPATPCHLDPFRFAGFHTCQLTRSNTAPARATLWHIASSSVSFRTCMYRPPVASHTVRSAGLGPPGLSRRDTPRLLIEPKPYTKLPLRRKRLVVTPDTTRPADRTEGTRTIRAAT